MKKRSVFLISILVMAFLLGYYLVPGKITNMITDYDPITFTDVLDYDSMRANYGIGTNSSPEDYGFQAEEINVRSHDQQLNLNGWYIPTNGSKKTIMLIHGRTSNRLKTMKYLELVKDEGLDSIYNICIPDLRNSGKSDPAKTFMGYKFSEDIAAYLVYLNKEKGQDTFVLYGFSQGAMATFNVLGSPQLQDSLSKIGIKIEKLIFDSALSNVYETLWQNGEEMGLPQFYFDIVFKNFSSLIDGNGHKMKMSVLFANNTIPALILHSRSDKTTSFEVLQNELRQVNLDSIQIVFFDDVDHVQIYQDPRYHEQYTKRVGGFIQSN